MGALALFISLGGVGYAATELRQADAQITACLDPASGTPSKIITTGSCGGALTPLSWNQVGRQGPEGP